MQRLTGERKETPASQGRPGSSESNCGSNDESDGSATLVGSGEDDSDASSATNFACSSSPAPSTQGPAKQQKADSREAEPEFIAGHIRGAKIGKPHGHKHRMGLTVGNQIHAVDPRCLAPHDVEDEQVEECREGGSDAALCALEGLPPSDEVQAEPSNSNGGNSPPTSPASTSSSGTWSNVAVAGIGRPDTLQRLEGFPYDMRSLIHSEGTGSSKSGCCGGRFRSALRRVRSVFRCRAEVEEMGRDGVVGDVVVVRKK